MPGRLVRSKISEQVIEIIGSRQGRELLEQHGWAQGMPIVIAQPEEKLVDAMALVGVHEPPVLLATRSPETQELCFLYVAGSSDALEVVDPQPAGCTTWDLYTQALQHECFFTFRMECHPHSSVVHALPPMSAAQKNMRPLWVPAQEAVK